MFDSTRAVQVLRHLVTVAQDETGLVGTVHLLKLRASSKGSSDQEQSIRIRSLFWEKTGKRFPMRSLGGLINRKTRIDQQTTESV